MTTEPTITERGYALLEQIKKECGLIYDPPKIEERPEPERSSARHWNLKRSFITRAERKPKPTLKDGEMFITNWSIKEAARIGLSRHAVTWRFRNDYYKNCLSSRLDRKWVIVKPIAEMPAITHKALPGEITMKEWARRKAKELDLSVSTIWMRIQRKTMPMPERRVVNKWLIFVKP